MNQNINFNDLIEKANKEKCEVTISYEPTRTEVSIQPWKPFEYNCPYSNKDTNKIECENLNKINYEGKEYTASELCNRLMVVSKERDLAVSQIKELRKDKGNKCIYCLYSEIKDWAACESCKYKDHWVWKFF